MTAEANRMAGGRTRPPSAAPGRPAEPPPAHRLLTAAEELFGQRSYHRTTVADICAKAGMATGSFYSYYESKAEIFAAVVRAINTDLRGAMKEALEHTEGGQRNRERASFRAYFDMLSTRPWIDRIVRESEFVDPGLFREYYEHLARGYARGVRVAQMDRDIDARYDPEVVAFAYTGIGNFVGMRWAEWTAGGRVPEDVLDDVLELLARGLAPKIESAETEPTSPDDGETALPHALWITLWRSWGRPCVVSVNQSNRPVDNPGQGDGRAEVNTTGRRREP
jgi:AcrR family transcriptional regulator